MEQLIQHCINDIQHMRIALGQLWRDFRIDLHLRVSTGIVHNEVVHAFSQKNADLEQQVQRDTNFPVFNVANVSWRAVTKACEFLLGQPLLFPCDFHTLPKQDVI